MEARHRPAAEALKDWGLSHRFAGASDRATIGNLVHDSLRRRASVAWLAGGETPWHLAVGTVVVVWGVSSQELTRLFQEDRHAPAAIPSDIADRLTAADLSAAPDYARADVPEWIAAQFEQGLGEDWVAEGVALAARPPLDLRVNTLKASRDKVLAQLQRLGAERTPFSPTGLRIPPAEGPRRHPHIQAEEVFQRGRIEVQDEGSQICALLVGARPGEQVLDYCAGAGGKTLAIAAVMENRGQIYAHDTDRMRLAPIFDRLRRAGARNVQVCSGAETLEGLAHRMDRVLVDAPCTGTGVWRRRPDAKWRVTPQALAKRTAEQDTVLKEASQFVQPGGVLAYATCSLLPAENGDRIAAFLDAHPNFRPFSVAEAWAEALPDVPVPSAALTGDALLLSPRRTGTDGFFLALLRRET
jgi:16S rRNA (cytosine967-C5)-methyltransferase